MLSTLSSLSRLSVAVTEALLKRARPLVTSYELFRIIWDIYEHPERYASKVIRRVSSPGSYQYSRVVTELYGQRFLRYDDDFDDYVSADTRARVFRVADVSDAPAESIACIVDPFAFVSHLSAMQRYGLSVRQPISLTLSTPAPKIWAKRRNEKMTEDYGFDPREADLSYFKPLQAITIPSILRGRPVKTRHTTRDYNTISESDGFVKSIDIGDLFVQMLDDPELCGGMAHIIEVWEENAEIYLDNIVAAVDSASTDIIRVRAGYILSERVGISDDRIDAWERFAQRGGSRKLDPSSPYRDVFSERWMISIND